MKLIVLSLFLTTTFFVIAWPTPSAISDDMPMTQVQPEETANNEDTVEDFQSVAQEASFNQKPKIADQKTKVMAPVPLDQYREFDEMLESPTELPLSGDLFKDLMTPLEESTEMEHMFKMKVSKFDENPQVEGPK
ncbi:hypothetical protein M3Y96_00878400 [Aphelenchoides besseyi]|nr:hypothetical protein M3Y96_00878400 [Aphelenchoides besseyi]